jgi:hypothetical protein
MRKFHTPSVPDAVPTEPGLTEAELDAAWSEHRRQIYRERKASREEAEMNGYEVHPYGPVAPPAERPADWRPPGAPRPSDTEAVDLVVDLNSGIYWKADEEPPNQGAVRAAFMKLATQRDGVA